MPTKTVIWLASPPRTYGNALSLVLQEAGAETCRSSVPDPNSWNEEFGHDPEIELLSGRIQGLSCGLVCPDSLGKRLENRARGSDPNFVYEVDSIVKLGIHLYSRYWQAKSHYLIQSYSMCGWYEDVIDIFPQGTRHIMIVSTRDRVTQAGSMFKAHGKSEGNFSYDECLRFLDRFDGPLALMEKDFLLRRIAIKLSVDDPTYSVMEPLLTSMLSICGLSTKREALAKWRVNK